ncbi:MAG: hypothetical protein FWC53_02735 [Firmicutes bacterium]|nr:hypothetical protein [Bacillota bacterium]
MTKYYVEGSKVIYEKTGGNTTYYSYDEFGNVIAINYNGTQYYYIKNIQNDIIGILNSNLERVVSYTYDSWGNVISVKDANGNIITDQNNIGNINPYRYKGYILDKETNLYYLQSRYYSPEWQRFINADSVDIFSDENVDHILINNLYAYCLNNPINMVDPDGDVVQIVLILVVVSLLFTAADMYTAYKNPTPDNVVWAVIGATPLGKAGKLAKPVVKAAKTIATAKKAYSSIKITTQTMNHINVSKHLWSKVLKTPTNASINNLVQTAIKDGTWSTDKYGVSSILYEYNGSTIKVTGKVINKVFTVSDAWVVK